MEEKLRFSNLHGHTDQNSNLRFFDSSIKTEEMLCFAKNNNYGAVSLTGHESLSDHVKAERLYHSKREYYENFKLVLGNEIYLVDQKEMEKAEEQQLKAKDFRFNHFLLTALDKKGHDFLQKQTTLAWKHYHSYHGQQRVPSFYKDIEDLMKDYKGHVVASTACLAGKFAENVLNYDSSNDPKYLDKLDKFIEWCINTFGKDNFKLELMPSHSPEQTIVNKFALKYAKKFDIQYIITNDAHYIDSEQRFIHNALLHSRDKQRDTSAYDTARLFKKNELYNYFNQDTVNTALENIQSIVDRVEDYSFRETPDVPQPTIPEYESYDFNKIEHNKFKNIQAFINSKNRQDNYLISLALKSLDNKINENIVKASDKDKYLARIDLEIRELIAISKILKQPLSSYFLVMREFIDIMWKTTVVGAGRGSSSCYLINYLLGITQVDAIKFELPYYRFLSKERVTSNTASQFPDIDTDTSSSQRENVINLIKENRGENHVLNFCTFNTIATRSAILTACRGLDIDNQTASYIVDLLPTKDGKELSLEDAILGNESDNIKPCKPLLAEIEKFANLKETILGLYGLVIGFSEHASGVYISNKPYTEHNALMTTKTGIQVTQYNADDSEYASALKYDFLSLDGCDRLQAAVKLLLKENKIEWQGSLYKTYQKYFNVDKLDYSTQKMYDMLFSGSIINAFQFSSETGYKTLRKLNARTFEDLISGNALMRLRSQSGEQPLDKYIRFKNDSSEWNKEMDSYDLNEEEKSVLHELLDKYNGICSSQELLMQLSMKVADFDLIKANALRKAIAKKDPVKQANQKKLFFEQGKKIGKRKNFLEYCWNECIEIQNGYAFSLPHAIPYTMILITEMNICLNYGLIYWQTACLNVNAKTLSEEIVSPDYAKVAKAIGALPKGTVIAPDINKSELSFTPSSDKRYILFGLNAVNNIGKNEITLIMNNRPYKSLEDFLNKNEKDLTPKKMVTIIKSGLLDCFESNRRKLMIDYISRIIKPKQRITITGVGKLKNDIPEKYHNYIGAYQLYKIIKTNGLSSSQIFTFIRNIVPRIELFEKKNCKKYDNELWDYTKNEKVEIDLKRYKKWLDDFTKPLKEFLKTDQAIKLECNFRKREFWQQNCLGNISVWEMDSLNMYTKQHELELCKMPHSIKYNSFNDLEENPEVKSYNKWRGRSFPQYDNTLIAGTVIDKNNIKGIAIVLTPNGVANVKVGRNRFSKYNQKIMRGTGKNRRCVDPSWFERGSKLLCIGHRIQNDFILNKRNTPYQHTLCLIKGYGSHTKIIYDKEE